MAIELWSMAANTKDHDKARQAVFDKIAPFPNWKNPIDAVIPEADFAEANKAAIWFTGGGITISRRLVNGWVRVKGAGYYANVGA